MTRLYRLDATCTYDTPPIQEAAAILRGGGLVAFPTETVYGLGANGLDAAAVRRIFAAKGRPADNPLIMHVASLPEAYALTPQFPALAASLAAAFWPGPLTMVLRRGPSVPEEVSAGLPTVAVRMPAHPVALALIRAAGCPIAAPSANLSGRPSPTDAAHVLADLAGKIDVLLDAGPTQVGLESTVLDLTGGTPCLLRPGGITREALQQVLGQGGLASQAGETDRPASPGMKYRHYAPRAPLTVVLGEPGATAAYLAKAAAAALAQGRHLAVLAHSDICAELPPGSGPVFDLGPRGQAEAAGRNLFQYLRACDTEAVDEILAEGMEEKGLGHAVMNRLLKAAGGRVLRIREGSACARE